MNHPSWADFDLGEDEDGSKKDLIQLHADLHGTETYTIEYETFTNPSLRRQHRVKLKDCLLLLRDGVPRIGLEWAIDDFGETTQVYVVFGPAHLKTLAHNFEAMLKLTPEQGLKRIECESEIKLGQPAARQRALRRLDSALY